MKLADDLRRVVLQAAIEGSLTGGSRDNWRFVRLGEVILLISGADLPTDQHNISGNGTPYITGASNIVNGSLIINRWTTTPKKIAKRGDILLTCKGTIGANCVLELEEAHIARQVMAIRVTGADTKFVHYYIQHYVDTLKKQAKSMIPGIERKNIIEAPFPLPSIDEQRRIVSRLDAILPLIAELEAAENELEALERSFPGDMRDSLLQAAIEGRLTGSNTDNWRRVRLGDISSYGEPVTKVSAKNIPANSWLLDLEDIEKGGRILRHRTAQETKSTGDKAIFYKGDILFSKLRPYLQKVVIAPSDGYCTPELIPFHCFGEIVPQYMVYFLKAPSINYIINSESYGVKMPRVGAKTMKNLLVLLPSINEQHKIVSCLNELLPLCEALGETVYDA